MILFLFVYNINMNCLKIVQRLSLSYKSFKTNFFSWAIITIIYKVKSIKFKKKESETREPFTQFNLVLASLKPGNSYHVLSCIKALLLSSPLRESDI